MHRQIGQHSAQVVLDNELRSAGVWPLSLDSLGRQSQSHFNRSISGTARQTKYSKKSDGFFFALRLMQNTKSECSISSADAAQQAGIHDEIQMNAVPSTQFVSCVETRQVHQEADPACFTPNRILGEDELCDFTCNSCQQNFTSKYALTVHVCIPTDNMKPLLHLCKVCGDIFSTECSLNRHPKMEEIECLVTKTGHRHPDTIKPVHCSLRKSKLVPVVEVESEQEPAPSRTDNGISEPKSSDCNNSSDSFQQSISKDSMLSGTEKGKNVCDICKKSFRSPYCLKKHAVVHVVHTPYKCNKCDRSFVKLGSLKRHKLILHKGEGQFKCDVCFKSFTDSGVLKRHTLVHTRERSFKCGECGKSFKDIADLNQHSMSHTGEKPYVCRKCGKSFIQPASLKRHTRMHSGGADPPLHICNVCGDVFPTQRSFNKHLKVKDGQCVVTKTEYRPVDTIKRPGRSKQLPGVKVKSIQDRAPDRLNNESFNQTDNDISPTGNSGSNSRNDGGQQIISKNSKLPMKKRAQTKKGTTVCDICNKSFSSLDCLRKHAVVHAVHTLYKCNDCGKSFESKGHLEKHIVLHIKMGKHVCNTCGRSFRRPVDLRQHILSHTGEKPYVCDCGSSFAKLYSLNKHKLIVHEGERPYQCDICFKSFTDRGVLKKHAVVHTGARAFKCKFCGKSFKEVSHLKRHSMIHTGEKPYSCHVCGKSFTQRGTLQSHIRVHTGEKPFSCSVCSKAFADPSNLRMHLKFHSKKKPHRCDICGKAFSVLMQLKKHIEVHIL